MIEFINYKFLNNNHRNNSWKFLLKIGIALILIGYCIYILREIIVGAISLVLILVGICFIYLAYKNWITFR